MCWLHATSQVQTDGLMQDSGSGSRVAAGHDKLCPATCAEHGLPGSHSEVHHNACTLRRT
eukprot:12667738-Heterocapsa_arctica.AAC.1